MAKAEAKTAVLANGLRYKTKASGSPFAAAASFGGATMSCFMCGKHRARSLMGRGEVPDCLRAIVQGARRGKPTGDLSAVVP